MDNLLRRRLLSLYETLHDFDVEQTNRLDRWRNLEPESAMLLSILVRAKQAKNILEIGTSNGYSTLWLADALNAIDGRVTSIEIEERRTLLARRHLLEFGLSHRAECLTIDAGTFLKNAIAGYDLIFLDAERSFYCSYWPDLKRLISNKAGNLMVVDNVISHREEVAEFISLINTDECLVKTIVPVGAGLLFVTMS